MIAVKDCQNPNIMDPVLVLSSEHGSQFYFLFYVLSFLISVTIIFITAIQKKYSVLQVLILISSGVFFFIVGTKVFSLSFSQWQHIFDFQEIEIMTRRTVLGGLIGLVIGLWITKKIIRFNQPVFDLLAVALPLTLGIQKLGCLFAGCCYGHTTSLPWGIAYTSNTKAFDEQLSLGLITSSDSISLSVHPTPIYQTIFCLVIAFIVWKTRRIWKSPGSQFLFSIILFGIFRFFLEFWRESLGTGWVWQKVWILSYGQWITLATVLTLSFLILIKEKFYTKNLLETNPENHRAVLSISLLTALTIVSLGFIKLFSPFEFITILLFLVPTLFMITWFFYNKLFPKFKFVPPLALVLCFLLMSQTYLPKNKEEKVTYLEINATGLYSQYSNLVRQYLGTTTTTSTGTDCDGNPTTNTNTVQNFTEPHQLRFSSYQAGLELNYTVVKCKYTRVQLKGRGFYGKVKAKDLATGNYFFETTYGVGPYFQFDWRPIGFGLGFQVGKFWFVDDYSYNSAMVPGEYEYVPFTTDFYPQTHLRVGPYDIVYGEGRISTLFPTGNQMPYYVVGLGTGFGKVDGSNLFAGYTESGFLLEGTLPIKEKYLISGLVSNNFQSQPDERYVFTLGFKYRFNFKTQPKKIRKTNSKYY